MAIALLRADRANAYLLDAIRTRARRDAVAAAKALATFKDDPSIVASVRSALGDVRDRAARAEIEAMLA